MRRPSIPSFHLRLRWVAIVSTMVLTALAGCRTPGPVEWNSSAPTKGNASFEIVSEELNPSAQLGGKPEEESDGIQVVSIAGFVHSPQADPVYPPEALDGNAGAYVLHLTATFSPSRELINLQRNPKRVGLPHPFEEAFFAAAKKAIEQWEVDPVREVHWRVPADGGRRQYLRTETFDTTIDIKFTFQESGEVN